MKTESKSIEKELRDYILKEFRTLKLFSKASGVPLSTLSTILGKSGIKKANMSTIIALCDALNISADELFNGRIVQRKNVERNDLTDEEFDLLNNFNKLSKFNQETVEIMVDRMVKGCQTIVKTLAQPVFLLAASAGTGQFLDSDDYELVDFPEDAVPRESNFGVRVAGDSMEPNYPDGSVVFVKRVKNLNPGEIGIFILNDEAYLKILGDDSTLKSINPNYKDIIIHDYDDLRLVGKVVGVYMEK